MLGNIFSEIETNINRQLIKIYNKIIPDQIQCYDNQDTSGLIQVFLNNYSRICEKMNWNERSKDPINKAYSIRSIRNKYYHYRESEQKYSEKQEILEILNILTFFELFVELFNGDNKYIEFLKNLEGMYIILINNALNLEESDDYEYIRNLKNEGRYLDYKTTLDNDILIWEITVEENPDFDNHVRIADSIIEK